jgi:heme/copper-type cytochrome/quinol oxidase subunit 2
LIAFIIVDIIVIITIAVVVVVPFVVIIVVYIDRGATDKDGKGAAGSV